ncbi:transposase [Arthrospira platensis BEA 1257B]
MQEFKALRELCRLSKNLYNVGLDTQWQYYFQARKHLPYESNYHYCKGNENYKRLNTDIAQQTLKVVDRTFRSFYRLSQSSKRGPFHRKLDSLTICPKTVILS